MSFAPADFPGFGGLDLRDPEDAQGAIDLLNVFERRAGELSTRCGLSVTGSTNLGSSPTGLTAYSVSGLACGFGTVVRTFTTAGATTASTTGLTDGTWSSVSIGGFAYFANGSDYILKAGASHTTGATSASTKEIGATTFTGSRKMPKAKFVGRQPKDDRLIAACFTTASGPNGITTVTLGDGTTVAVDESTVFFSQPGNPLYWDETDWVHLDRGDGETITAVTSWGEQTMIFKSSKFFVFYGNSTDSTGGPVFNFRKVDCPPGVRGVVSHRSGVYLITQDGIFVTRGGPPQRVSAAVDYLFTAGTYIPFAGGTAFTFGPLVFFPLATTANGLFNGYWLIFDADAGKWWLWKYLDGGSYWLNTGIEWYGYIYCPRDNQTGIYKFDPYGSTTTDNSAAISSYYTSPYLTYGEPHAEKHVRSSELHGTGTVTLAWGKDLQTHGTAETVAMSSGIGYARTGARGRTLSFKIAASAAGWTVNRVVPMLQSVRTGR